MEEIRNVSDKHMTSISLIFLYPSMRDNSWAARPFKFQQQYLRTELLRDPGLDSISRDFSNINFLCTNNIRELIVIRNHTIGKTTGGIMEEYILTSRH